MKNLKIVTKENTVKFISVMNNEEYLEWKMEIILDDIVNCPSYKLHEIIPFFYEWEIDQIKGLNEGLGNKILYDYLLKSGKDEEFLEEISEKWEPILNLKNIMDDGVILQMLIMEYDCFQIN